MRSITTSLWVLAIWAGAGWAGASSGAVGQPESPQGTPPKVHNREVTTGSEGARKLLRLDEREGDGVAWWPDLVMADGTVEVQIRGKDVMQRSFVGVAFHGVDEKTYDAVYFRPFNFRAPDPARDGVVPQGLSCTYTLRAFAPASRLGQDASLPRDPLSTYEGSVGLSTLGG